LRENCHECIDPALLSFDVNHAGLPIHRFPIQSQCFAHTQSGESEKQEAVSNYILAALSERLRDDAQLLRRRRSLAAMARVFFAVVTPATRQRIGL
jgi:hypothetical protein